MKELHEKIFKRKKERSWSNHELGRQAKINRQIIDNYQKNCNYLIKFDNWIKIITALDFKLELK